MKLRLVSLVSLVCVCALSPRSTTAAAIGDSRELLSSGTATIRQQKLSLAQLYCARRHDSRECFGSTSQLTARLAALDNIYRLIAGSSVSLPPCAPPGSDADAATGSTLLVRNNGVDDEARTMYCNGLDVLLTGGRTTWQLRAAGVVANGAKVSLRNVLEKKMNGDAFELSVDPEMGGLQLGVERVPNAVNIRIRSSDANRQRIIEEAMSRLSADRVWTELFSNITLKRVYGTDDVWIVILRFAEHFEFEF